MNMMKSIFRGAIVIGFIAGPLFEAPTLTGQQASGWAPAIVTIAAPSGANSGEPQLTVSDRGVLLSWVVRDGSRMTLQFAERTPTGWTESRTVAAGDDWSVNAMDVPSVVRLADGTLAASWMQKSGAGMHSSAVRLSYSKDDARTWAPSFTPHQDGIQAERLFASLFQMPGAGLGLIWLDSGIPQTTSATPRTAPNHAPGAEHMHQPPSGHKEHERSAVASAKAGGHGGPGASGGGAMTVRFASFDAAWKRTTEIPIDLRVCECCPTAAVVTAEGVVAAYRNRSDDEIRDIYVSRYEHGRWSEPVAVHADNWRIPACPVNGPALSARERNVAVAWFTVKQDQGQAYVAFSRDAGRSFGTPSRLDDGGSLGRVDVQMLADESALATWIEFADGRAQLRARHVTMDGVRSTPVTIAGLGASRTSGYPRIARHGDEIVFAWTETVSSAAASAKSGGGTPHVRTAVARFPGNLPR